MNTVLITGANKGIGREMVRQYHKNGWNVIACTRKPEQIESKDDRLRILKIDVTRCEDIKKLSEEVKDLAIDVLINNAGVWGPSSQKLQEVEPQAWLDAFHVNAIAPLMVIKNLLPQLLRSKLKLIVNMSSNMGSIGDNTSGDTYIYRSSKAALNMITKSLSVDLKNEGVTVVSLHPGWVKTDMGGHDALLTPEESVTALRKVLENVQLEDSGSFIRYDGNKASW